MVYNYKITKSAYDDIDGALDYVANKLLNLEAAKNLYAEINNKINKICNGEIYTKSCRIYGIEDETIRRVNVKKYILVFKIIEEKHLVIILRLLHEKQDIINILR